MTVVGREAPCVRSGLPTGEVTTEPSPQRTESTAPGQLSVTVDCEGVELAVIHATGDLGESGGALLRTLAIRLAHSGVHHVDLNLAGITAADLCGVRSLTDMRATLHNAGIDLQICYANLASYPLDWQAVPATTD